jgi:hypothetical protein
LTPSKTASDETAFLQTLARSARTEVVAAELFFQQLVAVDDLQAAFDVRFRGESAAALTQRLEKTADRRRKDSWPWRTSCGSGMNTPPVWTARGACRFAERLEPVQGFRCRLYEAGEDNHKSLARVLAERTHASTKESE